MWRAALRSIKTFIVGYPVYAKASAYVSVEGVPVFIREGEQFHSRELVVRRWPRSFSEIAPKIQPQPPTWAR
jgi:hypothetical protein